MYVHKLAGLTASQSSIALLMLGAGSSKDLKRLGSLGLFLTFMYWICLYGRRSSEPLRMEALDHKDTS